MMEVLEIENTMASDISMFTEFKSKFGICVSEYESFNSYVAALFGCVSTKKLKLCYQLPGDELKGLIEAELKKREVYV